MAERNEIKEEWKKKQDKRSNHKSAKKVKNGNISDCEHDGDKLGLLICYAKNENLGLVKYDKRYITLACEGCLENEDGKSLHDKLLTKFTKEKNIFGRKILHVGGFSIQDNSLVPRSCANVISANNRDLQEEDQTMISEVLKIT